MTMTGLLPILAAGSLPKMPPELQEEVNAKGLMEALKLNIFPQVSLRPMVESAKRIAESMLGKAWTFCRCSSSIPITDRPFVTFSPQGPGINPAHPEAEIKIPLNRKLFLHVGRGDRRRDTFECRDAVEGVAKI
jgi:hypothetical protein